MTDLTPLRTLPANWDSYGADPPDHAAIDTAETLLAAASARDLPTPRVGPAACGDIVVTWERGEVEMDVWCQSDGRMWWEPPETTSVLFLTTRVDLVLDAVEGVLETTK